MSANEVAIDSLRKKGSSLEALMAGCKHTETNQDVRTVGLNGWPDRDGHVTLDAAVMCDDTKAGSVAFVRGV